MRSGSVVIRAVVTASVLAVAAACGASGVTASRGPFDNQHATPPDRLAGTAYAERTFQGQSLPVPPPPGDGEGLRAYFLADTVRFDGLGTLTNIVVDSFVAATTARSDSAPPEPNVERNVFTQHYEIHGDSVIVVLTPCTPTIGCAMALPPTYLIQGDTLFREYLSTPAPPRDLFVRVP